MNTFNLKRFFNYAKRDFYYSKNWYLGIIGAWLGLFVITMLFYYLGNKNASEMFFALTIGAPMIFFFIAPFLIEEKRYKKQAIFTNILPVTNLEKYLHFWLKYVVVLQLFFWAIGLSLIDCYNYLTNLNFELFSNSVVSIDGVVYEDTYTFSFSWYADLFFIIVGYHSLCLLGYYFFKKNALVKTSIAHSGISTMIYLVVFIGHKIFDVPIYYDTGNFLVYLSPLNFYDWIETSHFPMSPVIYVIHYLFRILFPFGIWVATYFKMKEIEV